MNLQEALRALGASTGELPEEALLWARANWTVASGAFSQVLARCAKLLEEAPDSDYGVAHYALHLMAEKRETRVFPLVCKLAETREGLPEMLGETAMWSGSGIFISLFDGDAAALRRMANPWAPDPVLAGCAVEAMAWLTATGKIPRDETRDFLASVLGEKGDDEVEEQMIFWDAWARGVAMLAFDDLMPRLRDALAVGGHGGEEADISDLETLFRLAKEDPPGVFAREGVAPLDDAIETLRRVDRELAEAAELADEEDDLDYEAPKPVENPLRGVGRNDPCPCGSGKKFKKCCLAAE